MKANQPVRQIVIVGGGTAGWMAAAALSRVVDRHATAITLIESEAIGTVGVGEATLPTLREFHQMLGIDERDFISATEATFKTGIEFLGWGGSDSRYFNPFSRIGRDMGDLAFHSAWVQARKAGYQAGFDQFSVVSRAGPRGRFAKPVAGENHYASDFNYAYHLDAGAYASMLRRYAEANGVVRREARVESCSLSSDTGHITRLRLDDASTVAGDFFIDCSGFRSLLLGKALDVPFVSYKKWLPCDRAVAVRTRLAQRRKPYTQAIARTAGWSWHIPLQTRMGNGYVYASDQISDDDALEELLGSLNTDSVCSDPNFLRFEAGCRTRHWERNCVAIGLASGFLEPLESTSISLIQRAIYALIEHFPAWKDPQSGAEHFNRIMRGEYEAARDFIIAHYKLASPAKGAFWREQAEAAVPESLDRRLRLFRQTGYVEDSEFGFESVSWLAVILGLDHLPEVTDTRVEALSSEQLTSFLDGELASMDRVIERFPSYDF